MLTPNNPTGSLRRSLLSATAAVALFGGAALANAQTEVTAPPINFASYAKTPFALSTDQPTSSSSTADEAVTDASIASIDPLHLNAMQYQRRRYGRPRYRGGNTNADGSNKWMGYGGVGLAQPIGNTWHYDTPSWALQFGVGRQFSYKFAVPVEFSWDNFGLTKQTLDNQLLLYNAQITAFCNASTTNQNYCAANSITTFPTLDGNAHVWSFSVQPTYTIYGGDGVGAYVLAGAGFYHKVTNFTIPTTGEECDYYYGCYTYSANEVIDHYTSNAPGFDAGIGLTYKVSHFSGLKLYAEARYNIILNSQRAGITVSTPGAATSTANNEYPANSNRTTYIPIKFGLRF